MGTMIVVILSLLVGVATYALTIRGARRGPAAVGFEASASAGSGSATEAGTSVAPEPARVRAAASRSETDPEPSEYTYLRVTTDGPTWRDRVAGVAALIVLLVVSAGALAFGVYQLGHMINETVARFLDS